MLPGLLTHACEFVLFIRSERDGRRRLRAVGNFQEALWVGFGVQDSRLRVNKLQLDWNWNWILGSVEFRPDRLGWAEGAGGSGIKRLGEQNACEDRPLGFSV